MAAAPSYGSSALFRAPLREVPRKVRDVEGYLRRFDVLKGQRQTFDDHWQTVADIVWPDYADFTIRREPGERRTQRQFDMTATIALGQFGAILESLLTPRGQQWHELRASDDVLMEDAEVKDWFDQVTRILFSARNAPLAGFYTAKQVGYLSHGAFGNACLESMPRVLGIDRRTGRPRAGLRYRNLHIKDVWVATDHLGNIDTFYHCYRVAAGRVAEQFPGVAIPQKIAEKADKQPFEPVELVRCVHPNPDFQRGAQNPERMRFLAVDLFPETKDLLSVSGYDELPYMYSRWMVNPAEGAPYGRGPAMTVLADIFTLQEQEKTALRAGQKVADPPLLTTEDGVIGAGGSGVDIRAGAINYGGLSPSGQPLIAPLQTGARLDITFEMQERKRQTIESAFLVSLFRALVDHPNMTATQVLEIAQQRAMVTAPPIGRLQSEDLGPMIERDVAILYRMGALPPLPPLLVEADGEYQIEYVSPATRMAKAEKALALSRSVEVMAPWVQADPGMLEVVKGDETFREILSDQGFPQKLLRSPQEMAKVREGQAQAAAEAQGLETAQVAAGIAKDAAAAERSGGA